MATKKKFSNVRTYVNKDGSKTILQTAKNASRKVWKSKNGTGIISTTYTVGPSKAYKVLNGWHKVSKLYTGDTGSTWAIYQHNGGKIKRAIRFYQTKKTGYKRPAGLHAQVTTFTPIKSK